ncbi:exonuclease SbcCD subunit D C-terminal domain-containing protein [Labilibaculum antarcticum]|uniref:Nuclease SbcCD subunit D n=1 Tax=Labilibaculum antarcticum TaxID=1717717 RepID=A0A1Y1CRA8_9BACT|nr:exonuclease SbcCD subunit D C-terminal domain-containing protein [Labilibaculum antarcticum]BAX82462.1 exonuclease sbcCD subunit D [Labilibaculum antarcticum]
MRILHTSDWHIGQRLHGKDRFEEHEKFFSWLLQVLQDKQIDLLLVAGDIFDVGYPSNSALQQYYRFLTLCRESTCQKVIITGGNHDYVSTLNAPKSLLDALNISVIGGVPDSIEQEIVEIKDKNGQLAAFVCAVPYLRDRDIRKGIVGESHEERIEATSMGIANHYKEVADCVEKINTNQLPVIATGHLYMAGVSTSDSERDIQMGNQAAFRWDSFPQNFDYVALGHIHRPQRISNQEQVRYSGSPIPLSFSEKNDQKEVVVIEFMENKLSSVESVKVPLFRRLIGFSGSLDEVASQLQQHHSEGEDTDWAEIHIEEENYDPNLLQKYKELLEMDFDLEIVKPSISFKDRVKGVSELYEEQVALKDLTDQEVFDKLLERSNFEDGAELQNSYQQLLQEMNDKEQ